MYIALCVEYGQDDQLIFAQQLGVEHVLMAVERWDGETLAKVVNRVEKATLQLVGLEGLPLDDIAAASAAVRAAGAAGIGLVAAKREPAGTREPVGRGEALVGAGGAAAVDAAALAPVLAAADEAGVRLALAADAAGAGVDLDLGAGGDGAEYGERLALVRVGNVLTGREAFLTEGEIDLPGALAALQQTGYGGPVCAVPPPGMMGDTAWGHKGRAYDLGYLHAVLQTINSL